MGKGYSSARKIEKLIASAENCLVELNRNSSLSIGRLSCVSARFFDAVSELRRQGYNTAELTREYKRGMRRFRPQIKQELRRAYEELEINYPNIFLDKMMPVASVIALGVGEYATIAGQAYDNKSLIVGGLSVFGAGLVGLVYSIIRRK